jgi:PREDICTED: hypothetical protein
MKKICSFLLLVMLSVMLVSCGVLDGMGKKEDKNTEESTKKSKKKKKKGKKDKESEEETSEDEEETKGKKKDKKAKGDVVVDNDDYSITVLGIDENTALGYAINVLVENKTKDKNLYISSDDSYVNGVKVGTLLSSSVAAGKSEETMIFFDDIKKYGLTDFTDIEINVSALDSDDFTSGYFAKDTIKIYPRGEENATTFTYDVKDTDQVLVDNEAVKVVYVGSDKSNGYAASIYVENKTTKEITLDATEVTVNGTEMEPYYIESVRGGKNAFTEMSWLDSDFETAGLDKNAVSSIEFNLEIYDSESMVEYFDDKISITAQ